MVTVNTISISELIRPVDDLTYLVFSSFRLNGPLPYLVCGPACGGLVIVLILK
jgi:hypothetical protein